MSLGKIYTPYDCNVYAPNQLTDGPSVFKGYKLYPSEEAGTPYFTNLGETYNQEVGVPNPGVRNREMLNSLVDLCSNIQLWSPALGSD